MALVQVTVDAPYTYPMPSLGSIRTGDTIEVTITQDFAESVFAWTWNGSDTSIPSYHISSAAKIQGYGCVASDLTVNGNTVSATILDAGYPGFSYLGLSIGIHDSTIYDDGHHLLSINIGAFLSSEGGGTVVPLSINIGGDTFAMQDSISSLATNQGPCEGGFVSIPDDEISLVPCTPTFILA